MNRSVCIALASLALVATSLDQRVVADLTDKSATINDVMINYKPDCGDPVQSINLGDISISLKDSGTSSRMDATFTVDDAIDATGPGGSPIWGCMELHWLQTIWTDACPAQLSGAAATLPIIDPPKGGWDYMYTDGAARTMPNNAIPNFGWFIDDDPWYYNSVGEAANNVDAETYKITDVPADCPGTGVTGFSTYLVAEADSMCSDVDCLKAGEILLLAGFDWTISSASVDITSTFKAPSPFDVTDITTSLTNANFSGWTVYDNKSVCCPEPASAAMALLLLAGALHLRRLPESTASPS